jgi:ParE-like toxin of type II ParDE toxin-antitoxin system
MKVTIYDPVQEDIEQATKWFNEQRSGLGDEFATEVRRALEFIERMPLAAPPFSPRYRVKILKRFKYGIYYEVRDFDIFVVSISDLRRRPGHWVGRLP